MDDTEVTPPPTARRGPDRTLVAILVAIGVIVVVALVVVLSRGAAAPLDPSTPEGVVQRYAQAVADGDDEAALEYLTTDAKERCEGFYETSDRARLTFVDTNVSGDTATVTVNLTTTYGYSLFGSSQSSYEEQFRLMKSGGGWLISEAPYEFRTCDPMRTN
jgi:hypothetical protein